MSDKPSPWLYTHPVTLGELDALEIRHPRFQAQLVLQGAHLIQFAPQGDDNWLWLSPQARFEKGRAIRGGIPICWPWFGDPARNQSEVRRHILADNAHGFARTREWALQRVTESDDEVQVTLSLTVADAVGHELTWQGKAAVKAQFRFTANELKVSLNTRNEDDCTLACSQALHTYLPTSAVGQTCVSGMDQVPYIDTLKAWQTGCQQGDVTFSGETDRIYLAAPELHIRTPARVMKLTATGSGSTVIWNPGPDKAATLSDFPDHAWADMLCVETTNAATDARILAPGECHELAMGLTRA